MAPSLESNGMLLELLYLEVLSSPNVTIKHLRSSDPYPQEDIGLVINEALWSSFLPKSETGLRICSCNSKREPFIHGWSTTPHAATEAETKRKRGRWQRGCLRGPVCEVIYGLKLNHAFVDMAESLRSPEVFVGCWELQGCATQMPNIIQR